MFLQQRIETIIDEIEIRERLRGIKNGRPTENLLALLTCADS